MAGIKLAKVSGPKPAVETKPSFQYEVGKDEEVGEFKAGMFLKEPRVLKDFFAMHIGAAGDEAKARQLREAENPAVMAVLKAVEVDDGEDAASPLQQYVTAIMDAEFMTLNLDEIPSVKSLEVSKDTGYLMGQALGKEFDDFLTEGVEHAKEADAVPYLLRIKLLALLKDVKAEDGRPILTTVPPMRSAYKGDGAKGNRAPWGKRLPSEKAEDNPLPVHNGPWMKYKTADTVNGGDTQHDWSMNLTIGLPTGRRWADYITVLKTEGLPEKWPATLTKEDKDLITLNKRHDDADKRVASMLSNASYELNKRKGWVIAAFELDQAVNTIQDWFNQVGVKVQSYGQKQWGETAEVAAKRRNPFCLTVKTKDSDGDEQLVYSKAITKGKVVNIAKRCHLGIGGIPNASGIGAILTPPPRKGKDGVTEAKTVEKPSVTSTGGLLDVLQAVNVYVDVDGRRNTIMAKFREKDGGLLAATIRGAHANLASIAEDPYVIKIADAWDKAQNEAVAAAKNAA